ncbi:MAG: hypothetical protein KF861_08845 [Planctomycetaceae bacterium]|nr:hypothetical protein [Planctomycetaceae bacterium]
MRLTALTGLVVLIGMAAAAPHKLTAQNEEAGGQSAARKTVRSPLPSHYGRLGLSQSQREKLYSIRDSYEEKITELKMQIAQLESERDRSLETLLTPGQTLRLQELREEFQLERESQRQAVQDAAASATPES